MSGATAAAVHPGPAPGRPRIHLRAWMLRLAVIAGLAIAAWQLRALLMEEGGRPRPRAQRVTLLNAPRPLPPRRDDPPPQREPPATVREALLPAAQPAPGPIVSEGPLGVDAEGEGAGDGFGLVGRRGGRDITTLGGDSEGGGAGERLAAQFAHLAYAGTVRQRLETELSAREDLRRIAYAAVAKLWIDRGGRVLRVELHRATGSLEVDRALRDALASLAALPPPPPTLPQPLNFRIVSREAGTALAGEPAR